MDFDLRQWLLILGPAFVIGVILHGYIRMRAGNNKIRMKLDREFLSEPGQEPDPDDLNLLRAELPNGGARVISADPAEEVPVLTEPVLMKSAPMKPEPMELDLTEPAPSISSVEPEQPQAPAREPEPVADDLAEQAPEAEKYVVIHVLALNQPFAGQPLLELLLGEGMTFGEMDIFHRLNEAEDPQFSLASAVEPGSFNMATMDQFTTPGVTLFMRVHELSEPLKVLDEMLALADTIALELGGDVRDETRSVMTPQTVAHYRQSVQEFQFRHPA